MTGAPVPEPSVVSRSPACPSELVVDAFVSGAVDEDGRRRMLAHLAGCEACCRLVGALMTGSRLSASVPSAGEGPSLGHYRVGEPVGFGGMGMVYSAYDPRLERKVALKVLWSDGSAAVLHHEARAMAKLAHPNVVPVFDVGVDRGRVYVAMELVDGGTIRTWLASAPRPWQEVLARFREAGNGIAAAHAAGLVHRDIKPENLLLRRDGTVLVSDFGLARAAPPENLSRPRLSLDPTATTGSGTPVYMAPEQLRGEPIDTRADVFSFAVALWEALYGARPFANGSVDDLLASIARGPLVPPLRDAVPEPPPRLARVLARGMAFHRHDRFESIGALLAACEVQASPSVPVGELAFASHTRPMPAPVAAYAEPPRYPIHAPELAAPAYAPHPRAPHPVPAPNAAPYYPGNGPSLPSPHAPGPLPAPNATPHYASNGGLGAAPSAPPPYAPNGGRSPSVAPMHGASFAPAMAPSVAPVHVPPTPEPSSARRAGLFVAIAIGVVAFGAGGVLVGMNLRDAPSTSADTTRPSAVALEPAAPAWSAATAPALTVAPSSKASSSSPARPLAPATVSPPPAPKPAPSATAAKDAGAPQVAGPARKLRGFDFSPYGFEADKPTATLRARQADFSACGPEGPGCASVTCDFDVALSGAVSSASCKAWQTPGACTATEGCLVQKLRAIHFPAPPKAGACQLAFAP